MFGDAVAGGGSRSGFVACRVLQCKGCGGAGGAHRLDDRHGFYADADDAGEEVDNALLVVGEAVGVEARGDGGIARALLLVLIEHPIDATAIAEPIVPRGARHAGELVSVSRTIATSSGFDLRIGLAFLAT